MRKNVNICKLSQKWAKVKTTALLQVLCGGITVSSRCQPYGDERNYLCDTDENKSLGWTDYLTKACNKVLSDIRSIQHFALYLHFNIEVIVICDKTVHFS